MPYSSASLGFMRIVLVEGAAPHGRPQIIALQAQQQFEDLYVKLVSCNRRYFSFAQPVSDGRFIVEKDAAILHRRVRPDVRPALT